MFKKRCFSRYFSVKTPEKNVGKPRIDSGILLKKNHTMVYEKNCRNATGWRWLSKVSMPDLPSAICYLRSFYISCLIYFLTAVKFTIHITSSINIAAASSQGDGHACT